MIETTFNCLCLLRQLTFLQLTDFRL